MRATYGVIARQLRPRDILYPRIKVGNNILMKEAEYPRIKVGNIILMKKLWVALS
jgi:hypothetical protein